MRGVVLPLALLFSATGLMLGCVPRAVRASSTLLLLATVAAGSFVEIPRLALEGVYLGCWISVVVIAASVHVVSRLDAWAPLLLSANAGAIASGVAAVSDARIAVLRALPCVLLLLPASYLAGRNALIPVKIVSSWIIAIALLAATLQLQPVTPGYLPDHLE